MDKINPVAERSAIEDLAMKFMPEPPMIGCHVRLPKWLATVLDQRIAELKSKGSRITKEAVISAAVKQFLGITEPE